MRDRNEYGLCVICTAIGAGLPWILIVGAAGLSLATDAPLWSEVAAYMVAGGLLVLALSYFFGRLANTVADATRR